MPKGLSVYVSVQCIHCEPEMYTLQPLWLYALLSEGFAGWGEYADKL